MSRHLVHWDEVEWRDDAVGEIGAGQQRLGEAAGSVTVGLRRFRVRPGMRSTPPHAHGGEEEIFHVLSGSGLLWQDGATCEVAAGDTIVHLADAEAHTLRAGPEGLEVLAYGQRIDTETSYHPRSRRAWAGATVVEALGPQNLYELDAAAGPMEWPDPGARPANVAALADVALDEGGEGDCRWANRNLGKAAGSVRTGLRHERVPEGMLGCPPHCHGAEEELFVVLEGKGTLLLGDNELPVRAGHVLARPAGTGVAHALRGGPGGIAYLAYGTREPNDICYYPRSNKIAFFGVNLIARIEKLDYWDGER